MTDLDPRTIAADIMDAAARDIDRIHVWSHIGQAYDVLELDENITAQVLELVRTAGIDITWPDGSTNTELGAARVEIDQLRAEVEKLRDSYECAHADRLARTLERDRTIDEREHLKAEVEKLRAALCVRCATTAPAPGTCCSSHNKRLCHLCYRRTHFVEVCVAGCRDCAAERLPMRLSELAATR